MKGPKRTKGWDDSAAGRTPRRAEPGPLYQALFDISGDVLMVVEDDTTISMVNHRFEEMTGYGRDEVVGKMSSLALVPEEERERVRGIHRMRREDPQSIPLRHSHWMQGKGGRKWLAEITGTLIPGTRSSLLDLRDITEAHTLQQELLRRNEELAALVAVTREMVSSLELQDVLDRTLAIVCRQLGANHGFLGVLNEDKGELTPTTFFGEDVLPPGRVWRLGEGVVGWVAQHQQATLCG
ncbi:MAG TPA: PAS domain S-box protein, partial [Dehalococcoidia bacterium]|nr:PAS domain S-box protein [Dehalococcoidia bacterium]